MKTFLLVLFIMAAVIVAIGEKALLWHMCLLAALGVILGYLKIKEMCDD